MEAPAELDLERLPRHVAIIMDGNGRWARARGLSRIEGHKRGKDSVRAVVECARKIGIEYLTLFAFSTENWQRPRREVDALMRLLRRYLRTELHRMMKHEIRLLAVGNLRKLPPDLQRLLHEDIERTRHNRGMTVVLAVSYGGRDDIVRAARQMARSAARGALDPREIDETAFARALSTGDIPDPDLLIRTGGEQRISNFFLWQAAYTEIYFTETLWPDFREPDFLRALLEYQRRERRFGRVNEEERERGRLRAAP
ncbi:MAG: isoprenyl transferase [Candidatus Binatia bacterium]|nr:MAG: isoprenyl transferase [Candidatus Binatia bacterium]